MPGPLADGGAEARPWRARPGLMLIGALAFLAAIYLAPLATLIGWAFRDAKGGFTLAQAVKLASEPQRLERSVVRGQDRQLPASDPGCRIERHQRVLALVRVHPDHDHVAPSLHLVDRR